MARTELLKTHTDRSRWLSSFLWMSVVESLIAAFALVRLPSDSQAFLGLSPLRLVVLFAILLPGIACGALAILRIRQLQATSYWQNAPWLIPGCLAIAALCLTVLALLQDLYTGTGIYFYLAYAVRLMPALVYYAVLAVQAAGLLVFLQWGRIRQMANTEKAFLITWGWVYGGLLLLVMLIAVTRLGLTADPIGWGKPAVPLLEWQVWLGVLICLVYRLTRNSGLAQKAVIWRSAHPRASGWLISLALWALAMGLWASQPVPPGFFATPPRAPNYEVYPFSDAAFYDFHAQSLLVGLGYRGESIPPRPLYILFLAVAHLVAGQEYTRVILVQTAVLAFFPVIIYWIGKNLGSRTTGLVAAVFVILREWTSIVSTPFTSDVSNSKLLFADLPAALMISLVLLLSILWLANPHRKVLGLLTGGLLGISLLVRTQIIILLPVILLFYGINTSRKRIPVRTIGFPTFLFLVGFTLAVAPWLARSYRITGQFVFDHPESQTRVVAQRFNPETELTDFDRKPGESTADYTRRLSSAIRNRVLSDPGGVIQFITAHWLNSEIANLQIFPIRYSLTTISELAKPEHAFWEEWNGQATPRQTALMLVNLAVLTAGIVFLARKDLWIGILPLFFNLAYHFSNAAARNSGWRYLLPADWVFVVYFAAGMAAITSLGMKNFAVDSQQQKTVGETKKSIGIAGLTAIGLGILGIGLSPLAAERAFPRLYPQATIESTREMITTSTHDFPVTVQDGVNRLLNDPDVVVMQGRMLYPRYYEAKEGEEKTGKTGYAPLPYARYVFLVAGDPDGTVIFPQTQSDLPLRNAGDVTLLGCLDGLAVKARLAILPGKSPVIYLADPPESWKCSQQP